MTTENMSSATKSKPATLKPIDIRAQVYATHNTAFPLSSPCGDDQVSIRSNRTGNTALSHNPFESSNSSTTTLAEYANSSANEKDTWHLERYSESSTTYLKSSDKPKPNHTKLANRRGLQVITDFSKPSYHTANLVVDQVQAKQAKARRNHARSIVSQKGVQIESFASQSHRKSGAINNDGNKIQDTNRNGQTVELFGEDRSNAAKTVHRSQSQRSIVIGLCLPEHEADAFRHQEATTYASNLDTPPTPAIILTPADEIEDTILKQGLVISRSEKERRPVSSIYSAVTFKKNSTFVSDNVPPVPPLALSNAKARQTLMKQNPFHKSSKDHQDLLLADNDGSCRQPQDNKDQSAPNSCDTPRSQGWWNLLLSPMLSRAGSIVSHRAHEKDFSPPPVPNIPKDLEKQVSVTTPLLNVSPETPRRMGLAHLANSPCSQWTDLAAEKESTILSDDSAASSPVSDNQDFISDARGPLAMVQNTQTGEGLAAEYYHACAIEQLAGISYFECINHSCTEQLPKLSNARQRRLTNNLVHIDESKVQTQPRKAKTLGSPFAYDEGTDIQPIVIDEDDNKDDSSVTDFESDDEIASPAPKNIAPLKTKEVLTPIDSESEPDDLSPNVRKANTAAVVRARAFESRKTPKLEQRSMQSSQPKEMPNIAAIIPEQSASLPAKVEHADTIPRNTTPKVSIFKDVPGLPSNPKPQNRNHAASTSQPLSRAASVAHSAARSQPQFLSQHFFMDPNHIYRDMPPNPTLSHGSFAQKSQQPSQEQKSDDHRSREKSVTLTKESTQNGWSKGFFPTNGKCLGRSKKKDEKQKKKERRRCTLCICIFLIIIIVLCLVLALKLRRKGDETPIGSRWLNLTGYPPMPTGISTIAQPGLAQSQDQCVQPTTLWSCALPKDEQASPSSNGTSTPNFRFEIKFRNGTVPADKTVPLTKRASDPFTNDLFTANPAPPNDPDQLFLGNSTDNITAPFNGEVTPFYISFMSTYPIVPSAFNESSKSLQGRQSDLGINIPAPPSLADGTAGPVSLIPSSPYATSQPVRLYNRGQEDEHYGFYMYYDKSIFLSGISISQGSTNKDAAVAVDEDKNGGSTKVQAKVRCTWAQTRFLVKIFTHPDFNGALSPGRNNFTLDTSDASEYSSATDFARPGSFPYPTTIALDRHGGNINSKITYCYGMDKGKVNEDDKVLVFEDRAFGGTLVNGAPSFAKSNDTEDGSSMFDSTAGGIDGGTGGCGCTWQNWQ